MGITEDRCNKIRYKNMAGRYVVCWQAKPAHVCHSHRLPIVSGETNLTANYIICGLLTRHLRHSAGAPGFL